jgi:hypothetical protein
MSHFLGHGRQCDTFGQIWERINKASLFCISMVERAAVSKLAVVTTGLFPVFAGNSLIVRVDSSKSGFAKVFGQRVVGLSEFRGSVSKLAEFLKAASTMLHEMLA